MGNIMSPPPALILGECVQEPRSPEVSHRGRRIEQHEEAADDISESVGGGGCEAGGGCIIVSLTLQILKVIFL